MDTLSYLKDALESGKDVYLSSSVFRELTNTKQDVTLWDDGKIINITSTSDYNAHLYYDKTGIVKICDVKDLDTIIEIYRVTNGYVPKEDKINGLIEIFKKLDGIRSR